MNQQVTPLVESRDVSVHFSRWVGSRRRTVYALDDFSIAVAPGETVGLVGESGCGKSTAGRALLGAVKLTKGQVLFEGKDVTNLSRRNWRAMRKQVQMIFQDPYSALNPKLKVGESIAEPFMVHTRKRGKELEAAVAELLETVGMTASAADKYPHAFSGGQRQRIVIARALALHPGFVVADEATAALDVSIQAQIVNLLVELKESVGLSYLFISHNLAVVRARVGPGGHHVPGSPDGDRQPPRHLREPDPSLLPGPAVGGAGARPHHPGRPRAPQGRPSQPDGPAQGLPVQHPLPAGGGAVLRGAPAAAGALQRPPGGLLGELSEPAADGRMTPRQATFAYLFTLYFILGGAETMMSPLFPLVQPDLNISESNLAAILAAVSAGIASFNILGGISSRWLTDRSLVRASAVALAAGWRFRPRPRRSGC